MRDYIRAREQLLTVHETHRTECDALDREMLQCYDPAIDAFLVELDQLHTDAPKLAREWEDPNGKLRGAGNKPMSNNAAAVQTRIAAIVHLKLDVVPMLRTAHHITDVQAEINRLRKSIPEA